MQPPKAPRARDAGQRIAYASSLLQGGWLADSTPTRRHRRCFLSHRGGPHSSGSPTRSTPEGSKPTARRAGHESCAAFDGRQRQVRLRHRLRPRAAHGNRKPPSWAEVGDPRTMEPGADLMLLHPDGKEEVLVARRGTRVDRRPVRLVRRPVGLLRQVARRAPATRARTSTRSTCRRGRSCSSRSRSSRRTPAPPTGRRRRCRRGASTTSARVRCPAAVVFVSDRNAFKAQQPGLRPERARAATLRHGRRRRQRRVHRPPEPRHGPASGHPQGRPASCSARSNRRGCAAITCGASGRSTPTARNWGPLVSAFEIGNGTADSSHFQTQLSDGSIVVESYYNLNNFGFGTYFKFPSRPPEGYAAVRPGYKHDPRNAHAAARPPRRRPRHLHPVSRSAPTASRR